MCNLCVCICAKEILHEFAKIVNYNILNRVSQVFVGTLSSLGEFENFPVYLVALHAVNTFFFSSISINLKSFQPLQSLAKWTVLMCSVQRTDHAIDATFCLFFRFLKYLLHAKCRWLLFLSILFSLRCS